MGSPLRTATGLGIALALLFAGHATAATYCVNLSRCPVGGISEAPTGAGIQTALDAAAASTGVADTVLIGAGTYQRAFGFFYSGSGANTITISGAGKSSTILENDTPAVTTSAAFEGLHIHTNTGSVIKNVGIVVPDCNTPGNCNNDGLDIAGVDVTGVSVTDSGASTTSFLGALIDNSTLTSTTFVLTGPNTRAIESTNGTPSQLTKVDVTASSGAFALNGSTLSLTDSKFTDSTQGIGASNGTMLADNSIVQVTGAGGFGVGMLSASASFNGDHLTIDYTGPPTATGYGADLSPNAASTADLDDTIISGWPVNHALRRQGSMDVNVTYSDLEGGHSDNGVGGTGTYSPGVIDAAPSYVAGAYQLQADSPAIDTGYPLDSGITDYAGASRFIDGNGDGTATTDIGAFEFQPHAPTASVQPSVASAGPGKSVGFDASASTDPDPGDQLTYQWAFSDGTSASGVVVNHPMPANGSDLTATVTVTDLQQQTAQAHATVAGAGAPPSGQGSGQGSGAGGGSSSSGGSSGTGSGGSDSPGTSGGGSTPGATVVTRCRVPKLKGLTLAAAKKRLRKAGCALGKVKRPRGKALKKLRVKKQSKKAGALVPKGTKIALTLS